MKLTDQNTSIQRVTSQTAAILLSYGFSDKRNAFRWMQPEQIDRN